MTYIIQEDSNPYKTQPVQEDQMFPHAHPSLRTNHVCSQFCTVNSTPLSPLFSPSFLFCMQVFTPSLALVHSLSSCHLFLDIALCDEIITVTISYK